MSHPQRDGVAPLHSSPTTGDDDFEHIDQIVIGPAQPARFAEGTQPLHHPLRGLCKCGLGHTTDRGCLQTSPGDVLAAPPEPVSPGLEPAPIEVAAPTMDARDALPDTGSMPTPYAQYEALGLGAPAPTGLRAAKLIVSTYRLLGFSILTLIVVVLVGYITQSAFFYCSTSWVLPMSVAAGDEHVVSLQAQLVQQRDARDRLENELNHARRTIAAQQMFQAEFGRAIKSDLEGRRLALGRVRELAVSAASTRAAIRSANDAFADASRKTIVEEYAAGLIDRHTMLSDRFQLAQISTSNLALTERQSTFETRAQELEAQARSLDAILANATATGDTALSYDVLRIKQEYGVSRLDLARSIELRDTLEASVARQDEIVSSLQQSAYLRALRDHAVIVSIPYRNMSRVSKGAPLYGCRLGMILCRHVGTVIEILPGEVKFRHPYRETELRGQMVEVNLDAEDADAAADEVLFVDGKPVWF